MDIRAALTLPMTAVLLSACATVPAAPGPALVAAVVARPGVPVEVATEASEHDKLFALFQRSDQESLRRNPLDAIGRGDLRYADRFGDYITDDYYSAERSAAMGNLAELRSIDRSKLGPTDRIAYDVFEFQTLDSLKALDPAMLALTAVRPMNHFYGYHTFYPTFASGQGSAPFKTVADYENNLKRHQEYATYLDRAIGRFREGMATGVVDTRLTVRNMIEQLDTQLAQAPERSPLFAPATKFPDSIAAADRTRLKAAYRAAVADDLYPALRRLRDFLKTEYLPAARAGQGLLYMRGGDRLYRQLIESRTTVKLQPDEVHQLGLREVARIRSEMDKVRREVGFAGSLQQFFDHLRTDPTYKMKSREALTKRYYEIGKKVDAQVPRFFSTIPKTPLEIRPYEPFREKFQAGGSYSRGSPEGARPGVFYFNAYDLPSRTIPGQTTLYLHEGSPGHHFQISLAQENKALPDFMRFGGNTAYVEGWALYAETLGYEMGLFDDPIQRFGTLDDEMLRAMRLVLDTGIHAKGWTREQSIDYMLSNSGMGRTDATAEVERYIAVPGQALGYKIGALKIQELRRKAQAALGDRFDIREFHAEVLMTGSLPLPILEKKIDDWIAAKKPA